MHVWLNIHYFNYSQYNTTATATEHGMVCSSDSEYNRSCHTTCGTIYIVSLPHCDTLYNATIAATQSVVRHVAIFNSRHPKRGTACSYIQQLPPSIKSSDFYHS